MRLRVYVDRKYVSAAAQLLVVGEAMATIHIYDLLSLETLGAISNHRRTENKLHFREVLPSIESDFVS